MRLKRYDVAPPGGWRYLEPRTNHTSVGVTFGQLLSNVERHYQNMEFDASDLTNTVEHGLCSQLEPVDRENYCTEYHAEWPLLLRPFKMLAQPGDRGLGDIVERTIGPVGGDAYKKWYETIFQQECGCKRRSDQLNRKYPL